MVNGGLREYMSKPITIAGKQIGEGFPTYIIAEVSANHNQDIAIARKTVSAAAQAGVDAVKFQTYTPDTLTFNSDSEIFQIDHGTAWDGRTLHSIYSEGYMPWEWHAELFDLAKSLGMAAFSSPFDPSAVDYLANLDVPAFKIASFEIVDIPLVRYVAQQGKPVLISTGIACEEDIDAAINACREEGNDQIIVLKCTSAYPAPASELNLKTIPTIANQFDVIPGYSDHTMTSTAAIAAVTLGARLIERHITLDREAGGLDAGFSTSASEFKDLVQQIRETESALGISTFELSETGKSSKRFSRSLFVVQDVNAGEFLTSENVRSIRPNNGMHPKYLPEVLGKTFTTKVSAGTPLSLELIV
jgi:pseudaminic acid synthase